MDMIGNRKKFCALLCLLLTALCAKACALTQADSARLTIAAATDLHVNPTTRYTDFINPLEPYHLQIIDAFLWDAANSGADIVLLLGDVTNQGRLAQHEALLEKLRAAEAGGLTVYVLPGNHDIGEVTPAQFAGLYADFGYGEAFSRDPSSLSYSVLYGGYMLLLLDTHGYEGLQSGAYLRDSTLDWAGQQLEQARAMGLPMIAAGHYPLCTSHSTTFSGKEKAIRLLEDYGVQLYLSGHLHKRCVTVQDSLTELVVDQTIAYPCSYAAVTADGNGGYAYQPRYIAVSEWARQSGSDDPNLLGFDAYQQQLEQERCRYVVQKLKRDQTVSAQELQLAEDFFTRLSQYRAYGTLSQYADALRQHPGCDLLIRLGEGTIYSRWIPSVLADAVAYTTGFVLRDGKISLPDED